MNGILRQVFLTLTPYPTNLNKKTYLILILPQNYASRKNYLKICYTFYGLSNELTSNRIIIH